MDELQTELGKCCIYFSESVPGQENKPENNDIVCAYPEEWMKRRIGINYFIREQRDSMINAITEEDIEETGVVVENPVIGHIPSRQEIVNELEELLMTM